MEELLNLQTPVRNSLHKSAPKAEPAIVYSEEANKLSGLWAFAQAVLATRNAFLSLLPLKSYLLLQVQLKCFSLYSVFTGDLLLSHMLFRNSHNTLQNWY